MIITKRYEPNIGQRTPQEVEPIKVLDLTSKERDEQEEEEQQEESDSLDSGDFDEFKKEKVVKPVLNDNLFEIVP